MVGVDTVIHLAGAEWRGAYASLLEIDIEGTRTISRVATEAGVDRFIFVSHLGADRASAFPVMKAKAIAEEYIRRSGIDYTIFRTAVVFGPDDGFTMGLGFILKMVPYVFLMPGDGQVLLQPIWIEDLVTCMTWALEDTATRNQLYEIGGGEFLSMQQIVGILGETLGIQRMLLHVSQPYLRGLTVIFESLFPGFPVSVFWLDYQ
jgi:NADH dehydrogenase